MENPDICKLEILRLKEMLEKEHIPFKYEKHLTTAFDFLYGLSGRQHICYPEKDPQKTICSVIQGPGTYGNEENRIEIMGLITAAEMEKAKDDVLGWLSAENVFERIKNHWIKINDDAEKLIGKEMYQLCRPCDTEQGECTYKFGCESCDKFKLFISLHTIKNHDDALVALKNLGEMIFFTRKEAEEALKKINEGEL